MPANNLSTRLLHPLTWCLILGLLAVVGYLAAELYLLDGGIGFPLDDSWIHLQFARNLAAGDGLSYNAGELVTGSTAPLWTAWLAVLFLLPGSPLVWTKISGILLYLAMIAATYRLARELRVARNLAALAAALTAASSVLVWSALSGMEIPLFTLLSLVGMTLHLRERRDDRVPLSAVVLALAALARPEGLGLVVAALADRGLAALRALPGERRQQIRRIGMFVALAALILVPTMLFYRAVGGGFLPTTYAATAPGLSRWLPNVSYLHVVLGILFRVQPLMTLLAGAGVLTLIARLGSERDDGLMPAMWLLGVPMAYGLVSPLGPGVVVGNLGRYYFPFVPVVAVLGVLGIGALLGKRFKEGESRMRPAVVMVVATLILLPTVVDLGQGLERYTRNVLNVQDSDVAMALWLRERLPEEALLAVNDIGAIKFLLPNPVADLAGIASPEARRYYREAFSRGEPIEAGITRFLEEHEPDYLVMFPSWFPDLATRPDKYRELHRIRIVDNRTMGGDEVVLYSTPWTRYPLKQ
jgi:hypothetical protein